MAAALLSVGPAELAQAGPARVTRAAAAVAPPQGFTAVAPTRLLDTRTSPTTHTLGQGQTISLTVAGVAAVPASGVEAVVLNVTGIARTHSTYLTVFRTGEPRPTASNLNLAIGQPRANQVFAQVGTGGKVSIFNSTGSTDVLVDISGYLLTGSSYSAQAPLRLLDTRTLPGGKPIAAARTTTLQLHNGRPTPAGSSLVLNLTGISTAASTFVTAYTTGTARPNTSNLNLAPRQTAAVLVVVQPSASGQITFYNSGGPTHLIVDVLGSFSGTADYTPITPSRLLDTRVAGGVAYGGDTSLQVGGRVGIPDDAGAVVLSVTAVKPVRRGFLTIHPEGSGQTPTSSVNVEAGATTANVVVAQLSTAGRIDIYDAALNGHVLIDVVGWFSTNQALSFPAPLIGVAETTQAYSLALNGVAGLPPYNWSVTSGALPDGITVDAGTGVLSGTPTQPGPASFTVEIADASGEVRSRTLTIPVVAFVSSTVWGWGYQRPALVPMSTGLSSQPVQVSAQTAVSRISPGLSVAVALHNDGTVWAWGNKSLIGNGGAADAPPQAPVRVGALTDITAVATGLETSYALKSDGTVWAWGGGGSGLLGNGSTATAYTPVQVSGLTGVTAIAAGFTTALALKSDGTVWAWGQRLPNAAGTSGVSSSTPVQVPGLTDMAAIASGTSNSYAATTGGQVWGWGFGGHGALGTGTSTTSWVPVPVAGLSDVTRLAAGGSTAYALTTSGSILAWGAGANGRLGNGSVADSATPVAVAGLAGVVQVAAGSGDGYALLSNGTLWSWGACQLGLLGDLRPTTCSDAITPVSVAVPVATWVGASSMAQTAFAVGLP